jgi:hypothetical protein
MFHTIGNHDDMPDEGAGMYTFLGIRWASLGLGITAVTSETGILFPLTGIVTHWRMWREFEND